MAVSACSVFEKDYNLPLASPAKFKQGLWTGHTLLLLTRNNAPASQISLSDTFLELPILLSIYIPGNTI